jgi:tryptophan synthase beta chain
MSYSIDNRGFYGPYGGAFIPEILHQNIEELKTNYISILASESFQNDFEKLLSDYVGRPTPLYFASKLSAHYGTQIYLKREDLCHTGAHKINNAIGQVLLAKRLGKNRIIAETGAGQHGVATATACALLGLKCIVYMGEKDIERQAPNVARMKILGSEIRSVTSGSKTLKDATNEAIRDWINNPEDTHYVIGSAVGPHPYPDMVARLQSVISAEIKAQLNRLPTHVLACVGGGSNAIGAFYHFINDDSVQLIGAEAAGHGVHTGQTAATVALGTKGVLHASMTKLLQTDDGQVIEPHSISAGLDYPGIGPQHAWFADTGRAKYMSVTDEEAMAAVFKLSEIEGIIPAIETAHVFALLEKIKFKEDDCLVINLSGRGDKDLETIIKYMDDDSSK